MSKVICKTHDDYECLFIECDGYYGHPERCRLGYKVDIMGWPECARVSDVYKAVAISMACGLKKLIYEESGGLTTFAPRLEKKKREGT